MEQGKSILNLVWQHGTVKIRVISDSYGMPLTTTKQVVGTLLAAKCVQYNGVDVIAPHALTLGESHQRLERHILHNSGPSSKGVKPSNKNVKTTHLRGKKENTMSEENQSQTTTPDLSKELHPQPKGAASPSPKAKNKMQKPAKTRTAKPAKVAKVKKEKVAKVKKEKVERGPNPVSAVILSAAKKIRAGTAFGWEQVVEHLAEVDTEKLLVKEKAEEQGRIVRSRLRPWAKNGENGIARGEGVNQYVRTAAAQ